MTALKSYRNKYRVPSREYRVVSSESRVSGIDYLSSTINYGLWTIVLCLFVGVLQAQPTGYQGKRMMFKTDLVSPFTERGINLGLEYVVHRNIVVGTDFSLTGKQYIQKLKNYNGPNPKDIEASIRDMQWSMTGQYFLNTALPAPKGSYVFSKYSIGLADIFGNSIDSMNPMPDNFVGFEVSNVPSHQLDMGLGYQDVFFGFLLVDLDFGLTGALLLLNKTNSEYHHLITDFADKHGPNVYSLGSWHKDQPGGIGISAHLKIGILLF